MAVDVGRGVGVWRDEARVEVLCVPSSNVGHRLLVDFGVVIVEDEALVGDAVRFKAGHHAVGQDTACEGSESEKEGGFQVHHFGYHTFGTEK